MRNVTPELLEKIIKKCQAELERNPKNATAHHDLGVALMEKREMEAAQQCFDRVIELAPKHVQSHYLLGITLAELGKMEEAVVSWKKVLEIDKRNKEKLNGMAHYFIGRVYAMKGMWDASLMELNRAKKLLPNLHLITNALAEVHLAKGELKVSQALWQEASDAEQDDPRAALNACAISLDTGDYSNCIKYGQRALSLGQNSAPVHYNMGVAYMRTGDYDKAIQELEKAVELEPADLNNRLNLGEAYVHKGLIDKGVRHWEQAAQQHPESPHPYYNMGLAYAQHGLLARAEEFWQKALERDPSYLPVHVALASNYSQREMWAESLQAWQEALKLESDSAVIVMNIMGILLRQGRYSEALELPDFAGKDTDVRLLRSCAAFKLGEQERALAEFNDLYSQDADIFARHAPVIHAVFEKTEIEGLEGAAVAGLVDALDLPVDATPPVEAAKPEEKQQSLWSSLLKTLRK